MPTEYKNAFSNFFQVGSLYDSEPSMTQLYRTMDINVLAYLEDVLRHINGHPASRLAELLPGNWKKAKSYY